MRGWLTLLVLAVLVALISIGPATVRDMLSGVLFVRPPAATVIARVPYPDPQFQQRLVDVTGLSRGHLSASVVDLSAGATASIEGDRVGPAASLFKVPILIQVLADVDAGRLDDRSLLEVRQDDWTTGSGVLQARVGERLTVRQLTHLMIGESDNIAALMLLRAVGPERVNTTMEALGLRATHVADHRAGDTDDHATSAADMVRLLLLVATGQAVNGQVSERAVGELEATQHAHWLADGLPFWVKVAHKWGDLPQARNEVGIVFSPRASFVVAVLTEGVPPDEAAAAMGRLSRTAYEYLGARR